MPARYSLATRLVLFGLTCLLALALLLSCFALPRLVPLATPTTLPPATPAATEAPSPTITAGTEAPPTPGLAASPTAAAMPSSEKAMREGIQKVLDQRLRALDKGDEALFMATIDQSNLTWKRVQNDYFKSPYYSRYFRSAGITARVKRVQVYQGSYVKVWLALSNEGPAERVWVYRWVDGQWLHSEPQEEELGERLLRETDHFTVKYWAWDKPVIDDVVATVEAGYQYAVTRARRQPKEKFLVVLSPTYQTHPGRAGADVAANYVSDLGLAIRSPESFGGVLAGDILSNIVAHELIHLLVREVAYPREVPTWMNEGAAYYLTDDVRVSMLRESVRKGQIFSLKELENLYILDDEIQQRYALAQSSALVGYIIETYGGVDKYWQLLADEAQSRSVAESLQGVLGVDYDQFEKNWQAYLKKKYG
jgi:hypothetical protein